MFETMYSGLRLQFSLHVFNFLTLSIPLDQRDKRDKT